MYTQQCAWEIPLGFPTHAPCCSRPLALRSPKSAPPPWMNDGTLGGPCEMAMVYWRKLADPS